jgi:hypothetical protein
VCSSDLYYDVREVERPRIVGAIADIMISFTELALVPLCVATLLFCLKRALHLSFQPFRELFKSVILRAVVPLVASHYLPLFYLGLKAFLLTALPLLRELCDPLLREFQRRWPISGPAKAHCFLDLVFVVVTQLDQKQFLDISEQFFKFVNRTGLAVNLALADTVLNLFLGPDAMSFVSANSGMIIEKMYETLVAISIGHMYPDIREKAAKVLAHLQTLNAPEYTKQRTKSLHRERETAGLAWHQIYSSHIFNWSVVVMSQGWGDRELEDAKIQEVRQAYERPGALPFTHFLPIAPDMEPFITPSKVRKRAETFSGPSMPQGRRHSLVRPPNITGLTVGASAKKLPFARPFKPLG